MVKFFGWLFSMACLAFFSVAAVVGTIIYHYSRDLPDYSQLASYEPPVMTRIHAADGSLLAEYADQRRLFVPVSAMPPRLIEAYISAEDKTFFQHGGFDWQGIAVAMWRFVQVKLTGHGQIVGASTISQQVAKNFLVGNEQSLERKLREAIVVHRMEETFTKEQILELYLNEIFLGFNSYGVAAASLNYFGKSLNELSLDEMAYLAALPRGPNNYHPFRHKDRAVDRRNLVLQRMYENGYITEQELNDAKNKPLVVNPRPDGARLFAAESFAEEVRRELIQMYGKDTLGKGGLSVRTTLDPKLQILARQSLARGLIAFDRKRGYRGPVKKIAIEGDWGQTLAAMRVADDIAPWRLAVVLEVNDDQATVGLRPKMQINGTVDKARETGIITVPLLNWARAYKDGSEIGPKIEKASAVLSPGDVIYVAPSTEQGKWHLVQMPEVEGAMVAMDPHTGRVLALVGGFSYGNSQFNRVVQAMRQPGSSFKPIVYAAALDNGYTPASVILDAPIEFKMPDGKYWRPKNYQNKFFGPSTLRRGLEQSRNVMTVRLASDLGMTKIADLAQRLGIYEKLPMQLAMALGAGETTLLRMTTAYSMFANGGKKIQATLIDRVQDRYGKTIYRFDKRDCSHCQQTEYSPTAAEPELIDVREQVMSPYTAYQVTSMLEGVIQRGTGKKVLVVGKPVAGKTGTSNEEKDAWFIGYTPDLVVGAYIGYDNPKPMGKSRTGGELTAPIVADFMKLALKEQPATPFRVPRAIELIPIYASNGKRGIFGEQGIILEAFKPGDEPPENTKVIGDGAGAQGGGSGFAGQVLVPAATGAPQAPGAPMAPMAPQAPGAPMAPVAPQAPNAPASGGLTSDSDSLY